MKLLQKLIVRSLAGEYVAVPVKSGQGNFEGVLTTNDVGAFILNALSEDVSLSDLTRMVVEEFEVDQDTAKRDVDTFLNILKENCLIDI